MAWTTGNAADLSALLDALRTWIVDTALWEELEYTAGDRLSVRAPGNGAFGQPTVTFHLFPDSTNNKYPLHVYCSTGFTDAAAPGAHPHSSPVTMISLWNKQIKYWFFANRRRVTIVCKMSTIYTSVHAGFFLPWARPDQYPLPLFVGGESFQSYLWNDYGENRRAFCDPPATSNAAQSASWFYTQAGVWVPMVNQTANNSGEVDNPTDIGDESEYHAWLWPYHSGQVEISDDIDNWTGNYSGTGGFTNSGTIGSFVETRQGETFCLPLMIQQDNSGSYRNHMGLLDGVICPLGNNLCAEREITYKGRTYIMFPMIHRCLARHFYAVLKA